MIFVGAPAPAVRREAAAGSRGGTGDMATPRLMRTPPP